MHAVIKTGGKQYLVSPGQELKVELLPDEPGAVITLETLLVFDGDGNNVHIGKPVVEGATVTAAVLEHGRAAKIHVIKFKPKVRYRRNVGHHQPFTRIKIDKIA